jgi:GNAT superfamily N-acetyltransferase
LTDTLVRRLLADEVNDWRALRLRALTDTPVNFGSTYDDEASRPYEHWTERAARNAAGQESVMFVADQDGQLQGMAGAYLDPEDALRPHLISMWVAPAARRQGTGKALVDAVVAWARDIGHPGVRLFVVQGNTAAASLYRRCGFSPTGVTVSLPRDAAILEDEMRLTFPVSGPARPAR